MSYQFEQDYHFDSSKIGRSYGLTATPMRQGFAKHMKFLGHALAGDTSRPAVGASPTP
jgi:hypothetical protein